MTQITGGEDGEDDRGRQHHSGHARLCEFRFRNEVEEEAADGGRLEALLEEPGRHAGGKPGGRLP